MTAHAELNTPISFFRPLKLIPVLPPTDASTMASSVVGMLMNLMPRLNVDAANPPRSVIMPPPRLISNEWRVAPELQSSAHTFASDSRFLFSSFALIAMQWASFRLSDLLMRGKQHCLVVLSVRMNILS